MTATVKGAAPAVRIKAATAVRLPWLSWKVPRHIEMLPDQAVLKATACFRRKMTVSNDILTVIKIPHQGYKTSYLKNKSRSIFQQGIFILVCLTTN